ALLLVLCGACAIPFSATDATRIRTIGISGFAEPSTYGLTSDDSVIDASRLADVMTELNFHLGAELKGVVAEALRRQGYQVLEDGNPTAVDAVLNVEILGYFKTRVPVYAAFGGSVFKPMFAANATLRDASTKRTLFRRLYAYSALPAPIDGTILFRPD